MLDGGHCKCCVHVAFSICTAHFTRPPLINLMYFGAPITYDFLGWHCEILYADVRRISVSLSNQGFHKASSVVLEAKVRTRLTDVECLLHILDRLLELL